MSVQLPSPYTNSDNACLTDIASSIVAPAASVEEIACCARCDAIAASCAFLSDSICSFDAMLYADSAVAFCYLISLVHSSPIVVEAPPRCGKYSLSRFVLR